MSFAMSRCTRCNKLIPESEAQVSIERLKELAHQQGQSESELLDQHYPVCDDCLPKVAERPVLPPMSHEKIAAAVVAAIAHCGVGDDRFDRLNKYIAALKTDPDWQEHEVVNLKGRVQRLMSSPEETA